jgi:hypothetical protein
MSRPASRFGLTGKPRASRRCSAALLEELVRPGREQAVGRHLRILLAERTGPGVPRIGVERQPGLLAFGVDPGEL